MIKQVSILITTISFVCSALNAQQTSLDKVLNNYYKVNAIDKLQGIKSIVMSGSTTRNDIMPLKITRVCPDKYRTDFEIADLNAIQAYDGKTGWSVSPWTGSSKANVMDEESLKDIRVRADFDGILYKWKEKGHQIELEGKDTIRNAEVFKLKLSRKDGGIEYYYIDTKNYLLQKRSFKKINKGKEFEISLYFSNYKKVDGIYFPFTIENTTNNQPYSQIEFDTIELNVPVDDAIFNLPE